MPNNNNSIKDFLDAIPDEKLKDFPEREQTLVKDRFHGYRLDHQGVNKDGSARLFIQPVPGGKSGASRLPPKSVVAQVHVNSGEPKDVRDALFNSFKSKAKLIKLG